MALAPASSKDNQPKGSFRLDSSPASPLVPEVRFQRNWQVTVYDFPLSVFQTSLLMTEGCFL